MRSSSSRSLSVLTAIACCLAIVAITLVSLVSDRAWHPALEWLSHFKLQYASLAAIALLPLLFLRQKVARWIGCGCLAVHATFLLPWYLPPSSADPGVGEGRAIAVLVCNLQIKNRSYDAVQQMVRREQPDVAVFVEADIPWSEQLDRLSDLLPFSTGQDTVNRFGNLIYSRFPLDNATNRGFGVPYNPTLLADIDLDGQPVQLVATHLSAPTNRERFEQRNRQLDNIREYVNTLDRPVLVMGDLNISMWSPYYRRFARLTGLQNARRGFGVLPTWPAPSAEAYYPIPSRLAFLLSIPIDHVLVSPEIRVETARVGEDINSDHYPFLARLRVMVSDADD